MTDPDDVRAFDTRVRALRPHTWSGYVVEPKLDGLSIEVVYRDGALIRASTRGNGDVGEGVTENVRTIAAVPARLRRPPALVAVRGEVMMRLGDFGRLNQRLSGAGEPTFANPRNAAAGSLRQLDSRVTAGRKLAVFFYDILHSEGGRRLMDGMAARRVLASWGLPTSPHARRCLSVEDILAYHQLMARKREALDYEIDGIVVKVNDLRTRERLGATGRHPRWALAFKFAPRAEQTVIKDIVLQVGRTGILTPVALLEPVALGGVTISRATLHNRDEIARKDLRIGDTVRVVRAGDVIPEIVARVPIRRGRRGVPFRMPRRCPVCGAGLVREGPFDRCPNGLACPAQLKRTIAHFGSRAALDIRGLGAETVEALVASGLVRSVADLFALRARDLARLSRFGQVSAANLVRAIDRARHTTVSRFLYALGIPGIGTETARALAEHFGGLRAIRNADEAAIRTVAGIGPGAAHTIVTFLRQPVNRRVIDRCLGRGLRLARTPRARRGPLSGKVIVFTGGLISMTREEAEERARQRGAHPASQVTGRTDIVVAGDSPGSKYDRARALGVKVVSEREFLDNY